MIPENKDSSLPIANTFPANYIFEPNQYKQPYVTTLSTKNNPTKQEDFNTFSQPYTYSPDKPSLTTIKQIPQSRENRPTETKKKYIFLG